MITPFSKGPGLPIPMPLILSEPLTSVIASVNCFITTLLPFLAKVSFLTNLKILFPSIKAALTLVPPKSTAIILLILTILSIFYKNLFITQIYQ